LAERELIEFIRALRAGQDLPWLEVGIGDDAAVARLPGGDRAVLTTDMVAEGTHFEPGTPPEAVGWKAVARSVSDLAAMAARPRCVLAAVCMKPGTDAEFARRLCRALWDASVKLSAPLVGGDISSGPGLVVTVTALGLAGSSGPITRSGAQAGDAICVTGALGGSMRGRHLTFPPRVAEAVELAERCHVHAMIDISDGLSTDLLHIAQESKVGVALDAARIPVHEDARALAGGDAEKALEHALNDGEDYELLFCLSKKDAEVAVQSGVLGVPVTLIGEVGASPTYNIILPDGTRHALRSGGWEHLKT